MNRSTLLLLASAVCAVPAAAEPRQATRGEGIAPAPVVAERAASTAVERHVITNAGRSGTDGKEALMSRVPEAVSLGELLPGHQSGSSVYGGTVSREAASHAAEVRTSGVSTGAGLGPFLNSSGQCTYNVINQSGGRILTSATIHRFFWGDYWTQAANTAEASAYDTTWTNLANSPSFYTRLTEYGAKAGTAGVRYNIAGAATGSISDTQVTSAIQSYITNTRIFPGADDIFVVFLPPGTTNQSDISNGWSGHHNHFTAYLRIGKLVHSRDVAWAVIEYSSDPTYTNPVVSHEISEAISDPDLNAFYDSSGAEIGDICRFNYNNIAGTQVETIYSQDSCRCVRERDLNNLDYFGSGEPNYTIFRNGQWWFNGGSFYWNFGQAGDQPLSGDYNGDGKTEFALFRDSSSNYFVLDTTSGLYNTYTLGQPGDIAVPADYDGDGKTDQAVWRPSNGTWYIVNSSNGTTTTTQWGVAGDIPVPADYDNDGKADPAVRRPSNQNWYVLQSSGGGIWANWGLSDDIPVPGDFDGDGKCDWALFRPSEGRFYIWKKDTSSAYWVGWGTSGDIPVVRDYDGDWKADVAVWRPSNGTWYVSYSHGGSNTTAWGQGGDIPVERGAP
jgi:hypothetical protein